MEEENIEKEKDMTPILLEDLGVIFLKENSKEKRRCGRYQCQYCGKEFITKTKYIKSGHTKSCGCQNIIGTKTHGLKKHPLYNTWIHMRGRCYNIKDKDYRNYGGRGIQICNRWLDINNFIEDMYPSYKKGLSLDRVDVNGNYEIDNCRWTTQYVQTQNSRDIKSNNTSGYRGVVYYKDVNKWMAYIGVDKKRIYLGYHQTALAAAKAYETYVRLNNLEHNFTPALTEEEIKALYEKEN